MVAAVAGVPLAALGPARDALLAAGLLARTASAWPTAWSPPPIGEDLTRTECERLHREAARALMAGGAEADVVASHLLSARRRPTRRSASSCCAPAATAARRGAPHTAAAYLERALRGARPGRRPRADARAAGDGRLRRRAARLARRLLDALHEVRDRASRIDVLTRLAALNVLGNGDADHAELFEQELAGESDPDVRLAVEAASLDAL